MSKIITVFGATGGQGGGVVSALLKAIDRGEKYSIRAVTRNPDGPKAADLKAKGCEVVKCDMDDTASVNQGVAGSYGVFLVTNYWEHFSKEKEIEQGKRVIDASEVQGVKHLIYSGLENVKDLMGLDVEHFDGKGIVEEYLRSKKDTLPFTIVRFAFYFNNITTLTKPEKVAKNSYALNIPMQGVAMDGIDVKQGGECVYAILENLSEYGGKTIGLSGDKLTVQEYADVLSKHLRPKNFQDKKMKLEEYRKLGFPGAVERANMFEFYVRGNADRDIALTKKLNPAVQRFDEWVVANKESLAKAFAD